MSTSERPVVGDTIRRNSNGEILTIVRPCIEYGNGTSVWLSNECWIDAMGLLNNFTVVRHAPTPETAPGLPGQPAGSVGSGSAAKPRLCGDCFEEMPCPCDRVKVKPGKLIKSTPLVKPKPQRATYASLMASLRAEEGVPEPKKCSGCGHTPCNPATHSQQDMMYAVQMHGFAGMLMRPPEPEPWGPSVDPDFDIPYSWELS